MKCVSTRGRADPVSIDQALLAGIAHDGGLFFPERLHACTEILGQQDLATTAHDILAPYFSSSQLRDQLQEICAVAFNFPAPLRALSSPDSWQLELFHGPTAAFKDYAARFLAEVLSRLRVLDDADGPPTTILVATSGDTGAAVASAFHQRPGFEVVILYPDGRVSPRQAQGLGCWGDNVRTFKVAGNFDDCQRLARQALGDDSLRRLRPMTSANSISLGRLLPQMAYHAHAAAQFSAEHGLPLNLIVPTGNLGNATAALMAKRMGQPIGDIMLATNANDVLPRFFLGEDYEPRPARDTLANAMDVGAPSNFERLRFLYRDDADLRAAVRAEAVEDAAISEAIRTGPQRHGVVACPHTAAGLHVLQQFREAGDQRHWAVAATAHPAKFESIVEPLVGHTVEPPPALAATLARPASAVPLAVDYELFRSLLQA